MDYVSTNMSSNKYDNKSTGTTSNIMDYSDMKSFKKLIDFKDKRFLVPFQKALKPIPIQSKKEENRGPNS
jgi:hypothetical protein